MRFLPATFLEAGPRARLGRALLKPQSNQFLCRDVLLTWGGMPLLWAFSARLARTSLDSAGDAQRLAGEKPCILLRDAW
jgi:hypothetical protein